MQQLIAWIPLAVSALNLATALIGRATARRRQPRTHTNSSSSTPPPGRTPAADPSESQHDACTQMNCRVIDLT